MYSNTDKDLQEHALTLTSRKELRVSGVMQILNFDDSSVAFVTSAGELEIDGMELNIDSLDLERGTAFITGNISGINYVNDRPNKKRRIFARI